ncbi:MAG: hypothetical protein RIF46_05175, partial [Cyclobacteriaceae bacterium]
MKVFHLSFLLLFAISVSAQLPASRVLGGGKASSNSKGTSSSNSDKSENPKKVSVTMNPSTDAQELIRLEDEKAYDKMLAILLAYAQINSPDVKDADQLHTYLKENNALLAGLVPKSIVTLKAAESTSATSATGGLSNFGGTAFVDAFGSFLADRFKEELTIRYLEKFKTELTTGDAADDFKKVLPSTHEVLVLSDVFRFSEFVKTLQDAFQDDLKELPGNFPDWMR